MIDYMHAIVYQIVVLQVCKYAKVHARRYTIYVVSCEYCIQQYA